MSSTCQELAASPLDNAPADTRDCTTLPRQDQSEEGIKPSDEFPAQVNIAESYCLAAAQAGNWTEALERWITFQSVFPDHPSGYVEAGVAARELGLLEEAELHLNEGLERFPGQIWGMLHSARTAVCRQDWTEALRRWRACLEQLPDEPEIHIQIGAALRELHRLDEADDILSNAIERFPAYRWAFVNYAWVAARRSNWMQSLERWKMVLERFPDEPSGMIESGVALCELGEFEEAEKILSQATITFPDNIWAGFHFAALAGRTGNWVSAADRWNRFVHRFPDFAMGYANLSEAYLKLGQTDDAERLLQKAASEFPDTPAIAIQIARSAELRGDIHQAIERWQAIRKNYPAEVAGHYGLLEALRKVTTLPICAFSRDPMNQDAPRAPKTKSLLTPIPTYISKQDALAFLAHEAGFQRKADTSSDLSDFLQNIVDCCGLVKNTNFELQVGTPDESRLTHYIQDGLRSSAEPPLHLAGRPDWFPPDEAFNNILYSGFSTITIPNGIIGNFFGAPVVMSSPNSILADYSSRYAPLLYYYDLDATQLLTNLKVIPGTAVVIFDDVRPLNFCHWLLDWMPRLAFLGVDPKDAYVISTSLVTEFQTASLRILGFSPERIIGLDEFSAIGASTLVVPTDIRDIPHPCYRGASWAANYLRSRIGMRAISEQLPHSNKSKQRLYLSRGDAAGRKVRNEEQLIGALNRFGYHSITASSLSFAEQVSEFATASHIVGLHGAGLSNVVFSTEAQVIEICPQEYGTSAFYVTCVASGNSYATYKADNSIRNERWYRNADDVSVDIDRFFDRCRDLL